MSPSPAKESSGMTGEKQVEISYLVRLLHSGHTQALRAKHRLIGTQHLLKGLLASCPSELINYFKHRSLDDKLVEDSLKPSAGQRSVLFAARSCVRLAARAGGEPRRGHRSLSRGCARPL